MNNIEFEIEKYEWFLDELLKHYKKCLNISFIMVNNLSAFNSILNLGMLISCFNNIEEILAKNKIYIKKFYKNKRKADNIGKDLFNTFITGNFVINKEITKKLNKLKEILEENIKLIKNIKIKK